MQNKQYELYNADYCENLKDFILYCSKKYGESLAIQYGDTKRSYIELDNEIKYLGTKLINDFGTKSNIAVIGENSYNWILVYLATVCSGNTIVPIDKELDFESIKNVIESTDCKAVFCSEKYSELKCNAVMVNTESELKKYTDEGKSQYEKDSKKYNDVIINNEDVATIIYTSGTTGIAKGVMLTHQNLCANIYRSSRNLLLTGSSVLVLPLHHTFAFTANVLCMLNIGHPIYINKSLKRVTKDMIEYKPKVMFVVPMIVETFYKKIWSTAKESKKDKMLRCLIKISNTLLSIGIDVRRKVFKSVINAFGGELEIIICGGALLDKKYVKAFEELGITLLNGYGITECSPIVAVNRNKYNKPGTVGLPLNGIEVKIDNNKTGEKDGEILVKGDIVMKGYFNNQEKTNEVFTEDGFFRTGDIGYIDEDGFLYITGRIKNIIILDNGKNIYPEEIELVLLDDDGINEVVVREKDKKIIAEIYPNEEYIKSNSELGVEKYLKKAIETYNKDVPMYRQINDIVLRDSEFPKTTTKKIRR